MPCTIRQCLRRVKLLDVLQRRRLSQHLHLGGDGYSSSGVAYFRVCIDNNTSENLRPPHFLHTIAQRIFCEATRNP